MKFTVYTDDFKKAMDKVSKGVEKKSELSILENIQVNINEDKCCLVSTDLEIFIKTYIDILDTTGNISFVLSDTKTLLKAIKYFKDNTITFEVGDSKVLIKCGGKKTEQRLILDDFPATPEIDEGRANKYSYKTSKLEERFNKVKYAVATDDNRPILAGIRFNDNDMVASDGWRLAINTDDNLSIYIPFSISASTLKIVSKVLKDDITITEDQKIVVITDENTTVTSRLLTGSYFDYKRAMEIVGTEIHVNIKEFKESLKYLQVFASNKKESTVAWWNDRVLSTEKNCESKLNIDGKFDTPIGFNAYYMLDGLSQFNSNKITIIVGGKCNPMLLTNETNNKALVLPIRLRENPFEKTEMDVA